MKKRIIIFIIPIAMFLLPVCSFAQQGNSPFENGGLPSSQTLAPSKQTPFDGGSVFRAGPGGGGPGGNEEGDTGGGVGFGGPVSDAWWMLCVLAVGYGLFRRKLTPELTPKSPKDNP